MSIKVINHHKLYVDDVFWVRWCLEYVNRPAKAGMWNQPGVDASTSAWLQPKDGIVTARVEAKHLQTRAIITLAEVSGQDWIEFRWIAATSLPVKTNMLKKLNPNVELRFGGAIQGMTLVSRYQKAHVYRNGQVVLEENREGAVHSQAWKH